ncbi:MAG: hypothetical protein JXJ04_23385 [Spirochaetales bacterium]|nr:hypothetical protein [Spirochaetales bacterium]
MIGGTNDLGRCISPEHIKKNIADIHGICKKEGIPSVGATIPPTGFENDRVYNLNKIRCNRKLKDFFKPEEIPFTDLYALMKSGNGDENLNPLFDAGDGLHFSIAGYRYMGECLYDESLQKLPDGVI